jgi:hypothetical protein
MSLAPTVKTKRSLPLPASVVMVAFTGLKAVVKAGMPAFAEPATATAAATPTIDEMKVL